MIRGQSYDMRQKEHSDKVKFMHKFGVGWCRLHVCKIEIRERRDSYKRAEG